MWKGCVLTLLWVGSIVADIPNCDYFDTVDLTESTKLPNGSYLYENIVIPPELTGEYNYEILAEGERVAVPNHLRGCACKLGNCLRFCCHQNLLVAEEQRKCIGDTNNSLDFNPYVNISLDNGTDIVKHILDDFIVQRDLPVPCSAHYHLDNSDDENGWALLENGSLFMYANDQILSKQVYCLQPHPIEDEGNFTYQLVPHLCSIEESLTTEKWVQNILRILSIICFIVTAFIYLWIPKLRTLHGLCFVCYLICFTVTFLIITVDFFRAAYNLDYGWFCTVWGYLGYFSTIAAFCWLSVISYDLWSKFRGNFYNINRYSSRRRFISYNIFTWSVACVLSVISIIVDLTLDYIENLSPQFGYYSCYISTVDWAAMIYYYGPMLLFILFNITMFVLTTIRIIDLQQNLNKDQSEAKHSSDKHTFFLFLRLFVIMGIAWIFEIIAYLGKRSVTWTNIVYVFNFLNIAHGIIILILFVLKPSVLKLIVNRVKGIETPANDYGYEEEVALQDRNGAANKLGPSILN